MGLSFLSWYTSFPLFLFILWSSREAKRNTKVHSGFRIFLVFKGNQKDRGRNPKLTITDPVLKLRWFRRLPSNPQLFLVLSQTTWTPQLPNKTTGFTNHHVGGHSCQGLVRVQVASVIRRVSTMGKEIGLVDQQGIGRSRPEACKFHATGLPMVQRF